MALARNSPVKSSAALDLPRFLVPGSPVGVTRPVVPSGPAGTVEPIKPSLINAAPASPSKTRKSQRAASLKRTPASSDHAPAAATEVSD